MKAVPRKKRTGSAALALLILFASQGCAWMAGRPMDVLRYASNAQQGNRCLIVFLMGMGSSPKSFQKHGFVDAVRDAGLCCDMAAPDAGFAYYYEENLVERLKADVIDPAGEEGYDRIWLVGISMGALGSLFYLKEHPEDVEGVLLVAPFLGYYRIFAEIEKAGGLSSWDPGVCDKGDWQRWLWQWLKAYDHRGTGRTPVYLAYGDRDPYGKAHRLLASALPPARVLTVEGKHDEDTFARLWRLFLMSGAIRVGCE